MNKTLAITTIALVAVVMGMSTVAPVLALNAEVDQASGNSRGVLKLDACKAIPDGISCVLVIDANRNGCDPGDRRIGNVVFPTFSSIHLPFC